MLYGLFDGRTRTPEKDAQWVRAHRVPQDEYGSSYRPEQLVGSLSQVAWRSEWLSPLLVPLAALGLWSRKHRRLTRVLLALIAFVVLSWWLVTHRIDRFWFPALPLVAWLGGIGATWRGQPWWRNTMMALLFWVCVANFVVVASPVMKTDNRFLVALQDLRNDSARVNPVHRYLNRFVPAGSRALLVGDAQPFDLEVPALYNTCFDDCVFQQLVQNRSADERRDALHNAGVSHIYYHRAEIDRYRSPGNYGFTDFVTDQVFAELIGQSVIRQVRVPVDDRWGRVYRVVGPEFEAN